VIICCQIIHKSFARRLIVIHLHACVEGKK
jgi:hypothetical protein